MAENHETSRWGPPVGPSVNEIDESAHSNPVDQDVQGTLQGIAVLRARHRGQFLNPDDPDATFVFHNRREAQKGRVSARLAQGRHDTRGVNADQVGLKASHPDCRAIANAGASFQENSWQSRAPEPSRASSYG